jgi:hypothetical protein
MKKLFFAFIIISILAFGSKEISYESTPHIITNPYILRYLYDIYGAKCIKIFNQNGNVNVFNEDRKSSGMNYIMHLKETKKLFNDNKINRYVEFEKNTVEINAINDVLTIQTKINNNQNNVKIDLEIKLVNCPIQVNEIQTTNGNIYINDVTKDFKAITNSGEIEVSNSNCFVELYNQNGNVNVIDTDGITNIFVDNGTINAEIQNITNETKIINKNGNINIKIPRNLNANIEIEADEKNIKNQTNFLKLSKFNNVFKGTIGSGSNLMRLKAINGQISIDEKVTFSLNKPK